MKIVKLPYDLSACKVKQLNNDILNKQFVFIGKTKNKISIVCETSEPYEPRRKKIIFN